ncbi:MAG: hypothetical protein M1416_03365 [Candidatus Pacearchaeota archaeon]|nr:hypothetical protein [Candidatus Pacearchaeota archaeon]
MDLYSVVTENKWLLEALYTLIITSICMIIVLKTDRFFKLSLHNGIRYFRNAFLFFGIGFLVRYILGLFSDFSITNADIIKVIFEYFMIMAGFFLFYSLVWKKFASKNEYSSMFNSKITLFNIMAIVLALLDEVWNTYNFMFFSQIIIFSYTSVISLINYLKKSEKFKFLKFYFIGMLLVFAAWILNFLAASFFHWHPLILINIGIINVIFFFLFLYGVIKVTQK